MTLWQPVIDFSANMSGIEVEYHATEVFQSRSTAFEHAEQLAERFEDRAFQPEYSVKPLILQTDQ